MAQMQRSGVFVWQNCCNGSVPVPTLTHNRSSGLELLLTLIICHTLALRRPRYSVRLPWESLSELRNNCPQHDQVQSARVSNP